MVPTSRSERIQCINWFYAESDYCSIYGGSTVSLTGRGWPDFQAKDLDSIASAMSDAVTFSTYGFYTQSKAYVLPSGKTPIEETAGTYEFKSEVGWLSDADGSWCEFIHHQLPPAGEEMLEKTKLWFGPTAMQFVVSLVVTVLSG